MNDQNGDKVNIAGSLRNTLMISLIGGALVLAVILYLVVRTYAAQIAQSTQDRILSASVTSILDAAAIRNEALSVELPYSAFSILSTQADDRFFYAIHQDGRFLSGYEHMVFTETPNGQMKFYAGRYDGSDLRIATGSRRLVGANGQTTLTVSVAQGQQSLAGVLNRISRNAGLLGFGFFALMTLLSLWLTYATIAPLTRLAASVQRRGPEDLRPVAAPVPAEMAPLVGSLNSFMRRLAHSLDQSEEFIAEAAHRVRTPLATVRSYAETTLQRVDKLENRQALRAMVRAIDESSRAAGQLLDHAMITFRADHLRRSKLDLAEVTGDLIRAMRPLADMKDVDLDLSATQQVWIEGDAILLQNALRNLVDNALKYAPAESVIQIIVSDDPANIRVQDSGPGFPQDEIPDLSTRFTRGSNAAETIGSGLGLTIAQDVAVAHGGTLILTNRKEGGACATLSF
ncbi:HAMP domain-containing protein [Epibacterium sp. SM1979]|uniref:histidine kinase n=1 Tax=Tritonibacter litoralis TaxID=2662264 RepID=A0A843YKH0_9RHOB|nr:sensor histidine kinase [Tritonibacter litoralis]MQQ09669.1 HAMP domain-containing protein [Tritonibacter litoralis]